MPEHQASTTRKMQTASAGVTTALKLQRLVQERKAQLAEDAAKEEALQRQVKADALARKRAHFMAKQRAASRLQGHWRGRQARVRTMADRAAALQARIDAQSAAETALVAREAAALSPDPLIGSDARWLGRLGKRSWVPPILVAPCDLIARPGFQAQRIKAEEYLEASDGTMREKCFAIATLMRRARCCVIYSGAGMSTAAGVPDYASKADSSVAPHLAAHAQQQQALRSSAMADRAKSPGGSPDTRWQRTGGLIPWAVGVGSGAGGGGGSGNRLDAKPSLAHRAVAALERAGHVQHWITTNHDRLAQKAGYPQAKLNEIAGAWGDDYNPVVALDTPNQCGRLMRPDLGERLREVASMADLVLAVGSSLCGTPADLAAESAAGRYDEASMRGLDDAEGGTGPGDLVVVNLQPTRLDGASSVRVWALCDTFFSLLCAELGVPLPDRVCDGRGAAWVEQHPRCHYRTPLPRNLSPRLDGRSTSPRALTERKAEREGEQAGEVHRGGCVMPLALPIT